MTPRYSTSGLTRFVRSKLQKHHGAHKPGRVRSLCPDDADCVIAAVRTALKQVRPGDIQLVVRAYGGIVPNSYRYAPAGDVLELTVDLTTPKGWEMSVERGYAPKRSHGRGDLTTARLLSASQTLGRKVSL